MNTLEMLKTKKYDNVNVKSYLLDQLMGCFLSTPIESGNIFYYVYGRGDRILKAISIIKREDSKAYYEGEVTFTLDNASATRFRTVVPKDVMEEKDIALAQVKISL